MNKIVQFKRKNTPTTSVAAHRQNAMSTFLPIKVSDVEFATGVADVDRLTPPDDQIPEAFSLQDSRWTELAMRILDDGISTDHHFVPAAGVDVLSALRHVGAILQSSSCDDERKIVIVGYLLSIWFTYARIENLTVAQEAAA